MNVEVEAEEPDVVALVSLCVVEEFSQILR